MTSPRFPRTRTSKEPPLSGAERAQISLLQTGQVIDASLMRRPAAQTPGTSQERVMIAIVTYVDPTTIAAAGRSPNELTATG